MATRKMFGLKHVSIVILLMFWVFSAYAQAAKKTDYQEIEWIQLMPKEDLAALLNPPEFLLGIQDGSEQDSVEAFSALTDQDEATRRFQQALTSEKVIEDFDKKAIRIPGFVVPLKSEEQQRVTEFFIVPYFGACLHMPPPPPNQMIYGTTKTGFELAQLTEPFWFEGVINIATTSNMTGTAVYGLALDNIEAYN
jgi:hypothetical protein